MGASSDLAYYQQLETLHAEMLEAAKMLEWDKLTDLQERSNQIVRTLRNQISVPLNASQKQAKAQFIQRILQQQGAIKREVQDWQTDVKPLLDVMTSPATSEQP